MTGEGRSIHVFTQSTNPFILQQTNLSRASSPNPNGSQAEPLLTDAGRGFGLGAHNTVAHDVASAAIW